MSILTAVDPTTVAVLFTVVAVTTLALVLFFVTGSHHPGRITGPSRLDPPQPAWPVWLIFCAAAFVWFGSSAVYAAYVQVRHAEGGTTRPVTLEDYTPADMAVLSAVPPMLALFVFAGSYGLLYPAGPRMLGFSLRHLPRGVLLGLLAALIVLPLVYWSAELTERLYLWIGFRHPHEHELLHALGQSDQPLVQSVIVLAATIIVPIFEELLFRGHLQTLIGRALSRRPPLASLSPMPAIPMENGPISDLPAPPAIEQLPPGAGPIVLSDQPLPPPTPVASPWRSWLAVIFVSLLFASVHPLWTAPPIFILALALGYVYERTGNLYASITIHALFNTISTIQFHYLTT